MRTITFQREHAYDGDKIVLPATLILPSGIEMEIYAVVDTGAELTVLNRRLAPGLRIDLYAGEPITLGVVSGHISTAYRHDVRMRVLGEERTIRAAFCPDWDTDNFLGMQGFFDQMVVAFDHAERRIYF